MRGLVSVLSRGGALRAAVWRGRVGLRGQCVPDAGRGRSTVRTGVRGLSSACGSVRQEKEEEEEDGGSAGGDTATFSDGTERFIARVNSVLVNYPSAAFMTYPLAAVTTFGGLFAGVSLLGLSVGPNAALAYVCARVTARASLPLAVGLAVPVARAFPILQRFKMASLLSPPQDLVQQQSSSAKPHPWAERFLEAMRYAEGPIDKYGAALILARRAIGLVKYAAFLTAISQFGVDMEGMLTGIGLSAEVGESAGKLAIVTVSNTALLPVHLWSVVYGAPWLANWWRQVTGMPRQAS